MGIQTRLFRGPGHITSACDEHSQNGHFRLFLRDSQNGSRADTPHASPHARLRTRSAALLKYTPRCIRRTIAGSPMTFWPSSPIGPAHAISRSELSEERTVRARAARMIRVAASHCWETCRVGHEGLRSARSKLVAISSESGSSPCHNRFTVVGIERRVSRPIGDAATRRRGWNVVGGHRKVTWSVHSSNCRCDLISHTFGASASLIGMRTRSSVSRRVPRG